MALICLCSAPIGRAAPRGSGRIPAASLILAQSTLPVLADFDGDHVPDSVKLRSDGFAKTINFKFADLRTSEFKFVATSTDQGSLIGRDIDGDGDLDLIWIVGRNKDSAVVLINDGKGDFTQAKDNAPYASELNALVSSGDPSDQHSLQAVHQNLSLTSLSFPDIGLTTANRLLTPETGPGLRIAFNGLASRSAFLSYLHKRGPPLILS